MVKMEYSSVPNFIPLNVSDMCPDIPSKPKGILFKLIQPALPKENHIMNSHLKKIVQDVKKKIEVKEFKSYVSDIMKGDMIYCKQKQFKVPAVDVNMPDEEPEDANLLPSKRENIKSGITLFPVKPKPCGCTGPCEIITCEITVPPYVDQDEIPFILAMNIEEEEIDALVTRHCGNKYCDALSIDHDRCRRGLIKLYRCDKSNVCDICRITMNSWESRIYHNDCERKDEYVHNNVNKKCLLKDRLRLRELQILEDSKIRKSNYLDPVNGHALALEAVRNNKELVVIPKTISSQKPVVTITAVPNVQSTIPSVSVSQPITVNSQVINPNNIVGNMIAISPRDNAIPCANGSSLRLKESVAQTDPILFSNAQQNTYVVTSPSVTPATTTPPQNQYIRLVSSSSSAIQPNSKMLMPIRVMPITNLKTAPSLLHRQQGIPKFCVMAGNMITTLTVPNVENLQPIIAANITEQQNRQPLIAPNTIKQQNLQPIIAANVTKQQVPKILPNTTKIAIPLEQKQHNFQQKQLPLNKSRKRFFCIYCCKHFSTDWYFKKHVARHVSQKHTPKVPSGSSNSKHAATKNPRKNYVQEELDHDYVCNSPSSHKSSADGELETEDHCDEHSADEMNDRTTMISDSNEVGGKRLKCEETSDAWNENVKIFKNGIKVETQDDVDSLEDTSLKEYDDKDSLILNENCNAEGNKFATVSVPENDNRENVKKAGVTVLR